VQKLVLALDASVFVVTRETNMIVVAGKDNMQPELLKDGEMREQGKKDAAVQTPQPAETGRALQFPDGSPLAATHEAATSAAHVATMGYEMDDACLMIDGTLWGMPYDLALTDNFRLTSHLWREDK